MVVRRIGLADIRTRRGRVVVAAAKRDDRAERGLLHAGRADAFSRTWSKKAAKPPHVSFSLTPQYEHWQDCIERFEASGIYQLVVEKLYPVRLSQDELVKNPGFHGFDNDGMGSLPFDGLLAPTPERVPAACFGSVANLTVSGQDPESKKRYIMFRFSGGGYGGLSCFARTP